MPKTQDEEVLKCAEFIKRAGSIVALTGAGISTSAGIPDFRGPKGLYVTRQYDPDKVFDFNYFLTDPKPFYDFSRDFVKLEKKIKPTAAHSFLKKLEDSGKLKAVITQNIDSLHKRAGSKNVLELHGSYWKSFCLNCSAEFPYEEMKERIFNEDVPYCDCGGLIKPDVVFFGENVKYLNEAFALARESDLFFVIGTSCVVYPAAMIPALTDGKIVVVNRDLVRINAKDATLSVQSDIDSFFKKLESCLNGNLNERK